jgi:hypothetical protein
MLSRIINYLESVYLLLFFIIVMLEGCNRACLQQAGIQNLLKRLDSGFRTTGMTGETPVLLIYCSFKSSTPENPITP